MTPSADQNTRTEFIINSVVRSVQIHLSVKIRQANVRFYNNFCNLCPIIQLPTNCYSIRMIASLQPQNEFMMINLKIENMYISSFIETSFYVERFPIKTDPLCFRFLHLLLILYQGTRYLLLSQQILVDLRLLF